MATTDRSTYVDVEQKQRHSLAELQGKEVSRYNFYQLVELINQLKVAQQGSARESAPNKEFILFKSTASLAFPTGDVVELRESAEGQLELTVSFLGLHGSQSPMPGYYLDPLAWEEAQDENRLTDFLNIFNHRFLQLIHLIWRKYRYYVCFENSGKDHFSQRMFALVGLGSQVIRDKLSINHNKMLAYAGLLASPGRSSEVICSLVSHCFELPEVTLDCWQFRRVDITPSQQNRLGIRVRTRGKKFLEKSILGGNFTIGARVADRSGKYLLSINQLSRQRFLSFLPNGDQYEPLVTFVSFIMRDQLAWDLRLGLAQDQVSGMILGAEQNNLLGWTSFLGSPEREPYVTINVRD